MMGSLQPVEEETVSSENLANAIENMRKSTAIEGRRATLPKSWSTSLEGLAREIAAWLGYVDPEHEAGKVVQQITKLRATEAWTD